MARSNLILIGGIATVIAGVFYFRTDALYILLLMSNEAIPLLVPPLLTLGDILTSFLYVLGLVGFYDLSGRRSGTGIAGLVPAALAFGTSLLPWAFGIAYALLQVIFLSRTVVAIPATIFLQMAVGLLGDRCWRAASCCSRRRPRGLGRWTFLPFVLAFLYAFPLPLWAAIDLGLRIALLLPPSPALLLGPSWVLLGALLWGRASGTRTGDAVPAHGGGARRA